MVFTTNKVTIGKKEIDIIKSFPFFARAMYISPGGTLLDKYQAETAFYKNVQPILDQLVQDVQELWVKPGGRICGQNTKYIVNHLKDEYEKTYGCEVKVIIFHPGQVEYRGDPFAWGMTRELYQQISKKYEESRKWREDLWGVGHTMGVIYHALPLFIWKDEGLYITVESNLCNTNFLGVTQLHVTRTLKEMRDFLHFRYSASQMEEVDDDKMGAAIARLTSDPIFKPFNDPRYELPYKKQRTIPMKLLKQERKETLKGILKSLSKIPIQPRERLTAHTLSKKIGFRGRTSQLRYTLKKQLPKKMTKRIRVSKAFLTRKKR